MICFVADNCDVRCQCDPANVSRVTTDDSTLMKNDRLRDVCHSGQAAPVVCVIGVLCESTNQTMYQS